MTKSLRFDDEATEEMNAAAEWYEARRENLGIEFVGEVRQALATIASGPEAWALDPQIDEQLGVRRFLLRRFPYAVVYLELPSEIRILAIAHTAREPGYWRAR
jgi:toxin ParE1/3/4